MDDSCDEVVVSGTDGQTVGHGKAPWKWDSLHPFRPWSSPKTGSQRRIVFVFLHPISFLFYSSIIRPNIALLSEWGNGIGRLRPEKIDFISDSPREGRKTDWRRSAVAIKAPYFRDFGDLESYWRWNLPLEPHKVVLLFGSNATGIAELRTSDSVGWPRDCPRARDRERRLWAKIGGRKSVRQRGERGGGEKAGFGKCFVPPTEAASCTQ